MARRALTLEEIARCTSGRVLRPARGVVTGLCLDSRRVEPGTLFAALKGERVDGHDYVSHAASNGAAAVLVEREVPTPPGVGVLAVPSVERALAALGTMVRKEYGGTVVGIVGSCGKTTTKDCTAAVLSALDPVYATPGNRNNLLGLPETILGADMDAAFWVLELGISHPGEMEALAPIARPSAVLFTNILPVHTAFFDSLEAILAEKAKVLETVPPGAPIFLNGDDPLLAGLALPEGRERISYGTGRDSTLRIVPRNKPTPRGTPFLLKAGDRSAEGVLPLMGAHNLLNFAAAAAVGARFGLSLDCAAETAAGLRPAAHRGEVIRLPEDIILVDDSYNASPAAMASALESVLSWGRRTVAAMGEMLELGETAGELHNLTGAAAAEAGVAALLAVGGEPAGRLAKAFGASGRPCLHVPTWQEGAGWLDGQMERNDCIFVKGSRGIGLDGLVDWLVAGRTL